MSMKLIFSAAVASCFIAFVAETSAQVRITHLSPNSGVVGTLIRIHGVGFSPSAVVEFGGTPATTVNVLNANFLLAQVPSGAASGFSTIKVTVGSNSSDPWPFAVLIPTVGTQNFIEQTPLRLPLIVSNSRNIIDGDIDGDLDPDLVNISQDPDALLVNNGTGFFSDETATRLPGTDLIGGDGDFCDVDVDGDFDLVVVNRNNQNNQLFLNNGSGNFTEAIGNLPPLSDFSRDAACGDVDLDGDVDIIVASGGNISSLLINNGAGVFADETAARGLSGLSTIAVDFGDVDNDGDLDILFGSSTLLFINDGAGNFSNETSTRLPASSGQAVEIMFGDVDNDTDLDIFITNFSGQNQLFINNGTGFYSDQTATQLPVEIESDFSAAFGDIDGDGDLDLVRGFNGTGTNRVWRNDGSGFFSPAATGTLPDLPSTTGMELTDVNRDGHLDLATAELGDVNRLYIGSAAEINQAPVLTIPCAQILVKPGDNVNFKLTASDPDGDKLTFGAINLPFGASLNTQNGQFHWKTTFADIGVHNVFFFVQDTKMGTDMRRASIVVETGTHDYNAVRLLVSADGRYGNSASGNWNSFFPNGTCDQYIFAAGSWVGGLVNSTPVVAEAAYLTEFVPSEIGSSGQSFRVFNSSLSNDKKNWPPEFSTASGKPIIVSDAQNLVVQYNDLNGTPVRDVVVPLGIEIRQRSLAYNDAKKRNALIFIWEITNISGQNIDDAFFGFWTDTDIGNFADDPAAS